MAIAGNAGAQGQGARAKSAPSGGKMRARAPGRAAAAQGGARSGRAGECRHKFPAAKVKRAPVLTLFFLWRLHGQPKHAYLLLEDVRSVGFLSCKPSTIYALLSSMEKAGLVKSRLDTRARRARRLYSTTEKGWRVLASAKASHIKGLWRKFVGFLLR